MSDDRWQQTELTKDEKIEWLRAENARLTQMIEKDRDKWQVKLLDLENQLAEARELAARWRLTGLVYNVDCARELDAALKGAK